MLLLAAVTYSPAETSRPLTQRNHSHNQVLPSPLEITLRSSPLKSMNDQDQSTTATTMTDPRALTRVTCLETCQSCPPNELKCGICLELLSFASQESQQVPELKSSPGQNSDKEVVKTKVCGDAHFFHRICITSWLNSTTMGLNECPLDRKILYGTKRLPQPPSNLPYYVEFPGHDVEEHDAFYENQAAPNMVLNQIGSSHNSGFTSWPALPMVEDATHEDRPPFSEQEIALFRAAATGEGEGELRDRVLNALNDSIARDPDSERRLQTLATVQAVLDERRQRDREINERFLLDIQAALDEQERFHPDPREPMDEERSWEGFLSDGAEYAVEEAHFHTTPVLRAEVLVEELNDLVDGYPERRNQAIAAIEAALAVRVHREAEALEEVQDESNFPPPELASLFDGTDETFEELPDEVIDEHDADRERWSHQ